MSMKNFEKYEKQIKRWGIDDFAFTRVENKPRNCNTISCSNCIFSTNEGNYNKLDVEHKCRKKIINWLYKEVK